MRFFQYQATDPSGKPMEGTIRAASADAAREALRIGGYRVSSIGEAIANVAPTRVQPVGVRTATPATRKLTETPRPAPTVKATPDKADPVRHKTRPGSDRQLFFLMTQLHSLFKAGVTPSLAFEDLAKRSPTRYAESLRDVARTVGETGKISDALERYPYLYPPDVVGIIRAGEEGGFLPEAAQRAAEQLQSSHSFKRKFGWTITYFIGTAAIYPLSTGFVQGSLNRMEDFEKNHRNLQPSEVIQQFFVPAVMKQVPISIGFVTGCLLLMYLWKTMPLRKLRHRLVLAMPFLGQRAKAESLMRFAWVSSMVSRGGVPPQVALRLAADSIPSLELRDRLKKVAGEMGESDRTSTALRRSGVLPEEYANVVETGELTGTVPSALDSVAKAVESDFVTRDKSAAVAMITILTVISSIVVLFMLITLYKAQAEGTMRIFTADEP